MIEHLDLLMFAAALILLLRGFPVAFTLAGVGLLFALIGAWFEVGFFGSGDIGFLKPYYSRIFGNMDEVNEVLVAVPLFIFMGVMLERSQVAGELLETMGKLFGSIRGGLGLSVSFVGMLLAASTGIVGATVVTMGLISLPSMLKYNYSKSLACGSIAAAGTLGQIIPPSIVLVILGDTISNEYLKAQRELGNWAPEPVSVGDLFVGAIIPGLLLVSMYMAYQIGMAIFSPKSSPAMPQVEKVSAGQILHVLVPPIVLIFCVLGSILAGIATPTEAAAVGAVGAILLAGNRNRNASHAPLIVALTGLVIALVLTGTFDLRMETLAYTGECQGGFLLGDTCYRPVNDSASSMWGIIAAIACILAIAFGVIFSLIRIYRTGILRDSMQSTTKVSVMVFTILIGAQLFNLTFRGLGGEETVHELLSNVPGGAFGAMAAVMILIFFLGFFLDFLEIVFVVIPIVAGTLFQLGLDPIWVAIMIAVNLQTSFLTPPFGFALFYLRGVAPPEVRTIDIYKGIIPFVIIQVCALALLASFPQMATWLPNVVFG